MRDLVSQYFHTVFGFCNKTVKKGVFLSAEKKTETLKYVPHNCVLKHFVVIPNMRQTSRNESLIFYFSSCDLASFLQTNIL